MNAVTANEVHCATEQPNQYAQMLHTRTHTFRADVGAEAGSDDSAPSSHDDFDAALAACKALTATWSAKHHDIVLERVETQVERDEAEERQGKHRLRVRVQFHGPLSDPQRTALTRAVAACPIHKLMTRAEIEIETLD